MRQLRERVPDARAIVLTSFSDDERCSPRVRAGAAGYLLKDVEPRRARARDPRPSHAGQAPLSPAGRRAAVEEMASGGAAPRRGRTS